MKSTYLPPRLYSVICVVAFLVYENVALLFFPHAASILTGDIVKRFQLSPLSMVNRNIRSEGIYTLIGFGGVWLFSKLSGNICPSKIFGKLSRIIPETAYGVFVQCASLFLAVGLTIYLRKEHITIANYQFPFVNLILLYLLTAIAEETVFRGYIFQMTEKYWGTGVALFASSVLFGLDHLMGEPMSIFKFLCIIVFGGVTYSAAFAYTRSLWLPIGLHWGADLSFCLFNGSIVSPPLYSTAAYLEIGNITAMVELVTGIVLITIAIRGKNWRSFAAAR